MRVKALACWTLAMMALYPLAITPSQATPANPQVELLERRDAFLLGAPGTLPASLLPDDIPPTPVGESDREAEAATSSSNWARVVFQSYRDSNWEIYTAVGTGSNPARVTFNSAIDIEPHLNRGATRIAFVSNRDGNYEIYTMKPDGSDVHRLTHNTVSDRRPMWSPDGSRITFYVYTGNSADVYVMNADGSQRRRLTSDGASWDPSWSPDGQRILFAAYRNGQYGIWEMNSDGTGAHAIITDQPYAQHPIWSPDGSRIAYDADADADGFNELIVANADGNGARVAFNPIPYAGTQIDAEIWAASWVFVPQDSRYYEGPHYVGLTYLVLEYYRGQWHLLGAYASFVDVNVFSPDHQLIGHSRWDWNPMSQTTDTQPPIAWIGPLQPYSRYSDVRVYWDGMDVGQAGVAYYDVQLRRGSGSWTDWITRTYATHFSTFSGTSGEQVQFRVRAWDRAYNPGPWTPDDQVSSTWLYAYEISGDLRDTRAMPAAHVQISATSPLVGPPELTSRGTYLARLQSGGTTRFQVSAQGYGPMYPLTRTISQDLRWNFYLPPEDNLIFNGDFEEPDTLAGWDLGGAMLATVTTDTYHTGESSVLLAARTEPRWAPVEVMSGGVGSQPDLAVASDGSAHVTYIQEAHLYYTYRSPEGEWSVPEKIADIAESPVIAIVPSGEIHLVWKGPQGVYHTYRQPGGAWASPLLIGPGATRPRITADGLGNLHLVYALQEASGYSTYYTSRSPAGEWRSVERIAGFTTGNDVAASSTGTVRILVQQGYSDTYICRRMAIGWLCAKVYDWGCAKAQVRIDPTDIAHILCAEGRYVMIAPEALPEITTLANWSGDGSLAIDGQGNAYVVNISSLGGRMATYLRYRPRDGSWSAPVQIEEHEQGSWPQIEINNDNNDQIHLLHEGSTTANHYHLGTLPSETLSFVSQHAVLPTIMNQPTLSFLYRLEGSGVSNPDRFAVAVADDLTTTVVFSTAQTATVWRHQWLDLSQWAGQGITVTFTARAPRTAGSSVVNLDEVTLGSWLTPVPRAVFPNPVEPYASTTITITGENFLEGATIWIDGMRLADSGWVSTTQLTATVPGTLPLGSHLLEVQNPGGQAAALLGGLTVGRQTYLPIVGRRSFT